MKKLELLDLTGCYTILKIPSEILAMPNLKIKIGNVISPASEVVFIKIPERGISGDIFSVLSDVNKRTISQLIIHQEHENGYARVDGREEVVIPDELCNMEGIQTIWMRGNIRKIPGWIFKEKSLKTLDLCGSFENVPEILGDLKELSTLDLTRTFSLRSLPSSIGNLSKLTSLNLSECKKLVTLPSSIGN